MKLVGDNYYFLFTGYSDPSKDLRKAVKAKEKAAKKAKKEKKKKGEKAEDLFDPENLAKYRKEIEEKRKLASALSPGETYISRAFFNTGSIYFSRAFSVEERCAATSQISFSRAFCISERAQRKEHLSAGFISGEGVSYFLPEEKCLDSLRYVVD